MVARPTSAKGFYEIRSNVRPITLGQRYWVNIGPDLKKNIGPISDVQPFAYVHHDVEPTLTQCRIEVGKGSARRWPSVGNWWVKPSTYIDIGRWVKLRWPNVIGLTLDRIS